VSFQAKSEQTNAKATMQFYDVIIIVIIIIINVLPSLFS